jgi:transcription elongation GreA/GreB family factor
VDERIAMLREAIATAQASANEETKSSSGDKYETGRAMMQLEMEKYNDQLAEVLRIKQALSQLVLAAPGNGTVQNGSLVWTDQGNFFISVSAGQLSLDGKTVYAISAASPMGAVLLGRKAGDQFEFRGRKAVIHSIE